ncbi:MAG: cysteine--tRNA ligase, partial [Bacteroidota bacterium]
LIVRTAQAIGWKTTYVSNVTDVGHLTEDDVADSSGEDKMARALHSKGGQQFANVWDLARHYTEVLINDWNQLNLLAPQVRPRATQHMREQIQAIEQLVESGHAYEAPNAVYFSVDSFPNYGKLSGNTSGDELETAVRNVVVDDGKRDPRDFALWKKDEKHLMQWHSPWGWGFPGWHLECSVMAQQYLGDTLDLHAGGEDLIFPHHECEIAQAESLTGKPFARHWVHTRFLQVEGEKMAKSAGNFFTVRDLVAPEDEGGRGVPPMALRYALISGHYRKPYNFTFQTLRACAGHVNRYTEAEARVNKALTAASEAGDDHLGPVLEPIYERVLDAMLEDLNTPSALAAALEGVKAIQAADDLNVASARSARMWLDRIEKLLGIKGNEPTRTESAEPDAFAQRVEAMIRSRNEARAAKDWTFADAVRDELTALGVELKDGADGTMWRKTDDLAGTWR